MIRTAALLLVGATLPGTYLAARTWTQKADSADGTLKAHRLEIVDEKGRARITLGTNPRNGLFGVFVHNQSGVAVGQLLVEDDGRPALLMKTVDGSASCQVIMDASGTSRLEFYSPQEIKDGSWGVVEGTAASIGASPWSGEATPALKYPGFVRIADKNGDVVLFEKK